MSVEVLIVSFNTRGLLADCLASVVERVPSGPDLEVRVAVLDNGSTDGSAEHVAAAHPGVRLVRSAENLGFARANDRLATTSTADLLLLLNSDTILEGDVVRPLLAELEADPSNVVVGPRLLSSDGSTQASSQRFPFLAFELSRLVAGTKLAPVVAPVFDAEAILADVRQAADVASVAPRETEFLWATCWLVRRADVADGVFHPDFVTYDEDLDRCRRWRASGRRILYVPGVSLVHLGGGSSTNERKTRLMREARRRYYRVHRGRPSSGAFWAMDGAFAAVKRLNARRRTLARRRSVVG